MIFGYTAAALLTDMMKLALGITPRLPPLVAPPPPPKEEPHDSDRI